MNAAFHTVQHAIINDPMNASMREKGYMPVYTAGPRAKIMIVGQAPGSKAQASLTPWNDVSGVLLRQWLGVSDSEFYDPNTFALVPMDFYYPGKGTHGDMPPRKGFAQKWHPPLLALMPDIQLIILVGAYAQKYYLGKDKKENLTETVRLYREYLPRYFPLVHPSPLNFRWRAKNSWFESEILPELRYWVARYLHE